jgi:transposase
VVGFGGGVANQQTVKKKRRIHSAEFKARVALETLKGIKTISQIAQDEGVYPVDVSAWKKELQERLPKVFGSKSDAKAEAADAKRFKELESEKSELKKMLADEMLKNRVLNEALEKSSEDRAVRNEPVVTRQRTTS